MRHLAGEFAQDGRTLLDRQFDERYAFLLAAAGEKSPAGCSHVLYPVCLKAGDDVAPAIHYQHGYRCAAQFPGLAAWDRKDIPGTKGPPKAVEGNDDTI